MVPCDAATAKPAMIQRSIQSARAASAVVQADEGRLVDLVEVKSVAHRSRQRAELFRQRIAVGLGVEHVGPAETRRAQPRSPNSAASGAWCERRENMLSAKRQPACRLQPGRTAGA